MSESGTRVLKFGAGQWVLGASAAALIMLCGVMFLLLLPEVLRTGGILGGAAILALFAGSAWLAAFVWQDAMAKKNWRIDLELDQLRLLLPPRRSFLSRPGPWIGTSARQDLQAVERRVEVVETIGIEVAVISWALRLATEEIVLLGDDRPVSRTDSYTDDVGKAARAVADWAGLAVTEQDVVHGKAGFLGMVGVSVPDWPSKA